MRKTIKMWQDILITIVTLFFAYALIPQIVNGFKTKRKMITTQTSAITFIGMYILCFVYYTLNFFFSTTIAFITGTLWFILFIQSIIYKK
jgi:fatty acid desaturase